MIDHALRDHIDVLPEVARALDGGLPVVALESTIVTHGMPYPDNVSTARSLETIIRGRGATPATIAVIGGRIRIGLDDSMLEWLGKAQGMRKLSRADLAHAIATRANGATTVAATMILAHLAGIRVFATGGIGGVHRGAESTFDISADLDEFVKTPVCVVCAGPKALLDLPKTLEALETRGVPVIGFRTDELPAFWSRASGLAAPLRCDNAYEIAALMRAQHALDARGGVLVTNPIPAQAEIPRAEMATHIDAAVADAERSGIGGKALTPFLLDRILAATNGRSLRANIALAENNALLAADIAVALGGIAPVRT
jgi:pseudouridine-5'-phosphate glycosidase